MIGRAMFLLLVAVSLVMCTKEKAEDNCCVEQSEFSYSGTEDQDSFLWDPAESGEDFVRIGAYQMLGSPDFFFSEHLIIKIPPEVGQIEPIQGPAVRYRHVFEDYLGDDYSIDTTKNNSLEVICIDTLSGIISVSFDLHFVRDEDPTYPFIKEVSFTNGLFCGAYAN